MKLAGTFFLQIIQMALYLQVMVRNDDGQIYHSSTSM